LLQPFTLLGYRLMHPPSQFPRNLLDQEIEKPQKTFATRSPNSRAR
jgi:hypothetical protein